MLRYKAYSIFARRERCSEEYPCSSKIDAAPHHRLPCQFVIICVEPL